MCYLKDIKYNAWKQINDLKENVLHLNPYIERIDENTNNL